MTRLLSPRLPLGPVDAGPPLPHDEGAGLRSLSASAVLDTPPEPADDDRTPLAADVCGTPVAALTVLDVVRQCLSGVLRSRLARAQELVAGSRRRRPLLVPGAGR